MADIEAFPAVLGPSETWTKLNAIVTAANAATAHAADSSNPHGATLTQDTLVVATITLDGVDVGTALAGLSPGTSGAVAATLTADPLHPTPASRPAGALGEIGYYDGRWFGCYDSATPKWRALTEDKSFCVVHTLAGTDVAVGDGTAAYQVGHDLDGWNIVSVLATVHTAGTTGTTDVQLRRRRGATTGTDVDVLSTKCSIDSGERSSATAATAAVVNTSNDDLALADLLFIDVDAVSTTAPQGLTVTVVARPPAA